MLTTQEFSLIPLVGFNSISIHQTNLCFYKENRCKKYIDFLWKNKQKHNFKSVTCKEEFTEDSDLLIGVSNFYLMTVIQSCLLNSVDQF